MPVPAHPKIYHICHIDRLPSIINEDGLWCDSITNQRTLPGSMIGMNKIKERRLYELTLNSYPDLFIGDCVPLYFCPRSIMLYLINKANHPELMYRGGQDPIIHLEADLYQTAAWADQNNTRWAFTLSNAGARYVEDRNDLDHLGELNWTAIQSNSWSDSHIKEGKQAEFLMERKFPWFLFERIGVKSKRIFDKVLEILPDSQHQPLVQIKPDWYY